MPKIIDHNLNRDQLLDAAVKAGAKYDLGGITNQTIAQMSGKPEPYIYRYFLDRDDLIEKAFFRSDENFFTTLSDNLPLLFDQTLSFPERFKNFLDVSWDYMVSDLDYCKFYVRYYYSNANTPQFREKHRNIGIKFYEKIACFFKSNPGDFVIHQVFSGIIWSVMDIAVGFAEDTEQNRKTIYEVIASFLRPYLKEGIK